MGLNGQGVNEIGSQWICLCRTFGAVKDPYPKPGAAPLASIFRPAGASTPYLRFIYWNIC